MVKVIQKNINDISYSTFRLVDIFDPLMMYYIVKNFDGSYENVSVDKVKKTHKYKSFKKKYNDIKELDDVAIVDKKLRVKHKRNDEYKYVFLEDGNKLRIMISSMIGGTQRKLTGIFKHIGANEDSAMEIHGKDSTKNGNSAQTSSVSKDDANSGVDSVSENGSVSYDEGQDENEVSQSASSAASAASAQRAPGSIDTVSSEFSLTPMDVDEGQGENEVSQSLIPQYMEEYFSEENKSFRLPKQTFFERSNYSAYESNLKNLGVEATIGKYIDDLIYGSIGIIDGFEEKINEYFERKYNSKYKDTYFFKKLVLSNVLFYIQEITRFKTLVEHFIELYTRSGAFVQCGGDRGNRNEVCDSDDPIYCNLRDRLIRDIIHDFKGHRSNIPGKTIDTFVQMFSNNGSEISFENSENYTYGNIQNPLADVEKSYREIIMRKCIDYDLLHFIITDTKNDNVPEDKSKIQTLVTKKNWENSFLYKVYGDKSKSIISYTTDNNISNKIKSKIPVETLKFYYTIAGIFDAEINQKSATSILNDGFLSVDQSIKTSTGLKTINSIAKNSSNLELDLRIMNSISIKYSRHSFRKRPRTDETISEFLENIYLHFVSLQIDKDKFIFKCKFVYHHGNVVVDDMKLNKTDFRKEESIESKEFTVPQALFTVTNVANFINVDRKKSEIDDMLKHLKELLIKVHGNNPLLKSNMFSRLYILSLKSFGDYVQFEFVKECNRIIGKNTNNTTPSRLFITSTDVIAYSQGICNNVPILAGMINPDIFWLLEDITKKNPTISDDIKKYMQASAKDKALNFKHVGLFYEGNMKLEYLIATNSKLNLDNWNVTMNDVMNIFNGNDELLITKPNIKSINEFRNWISSGIELTIAGESFKFESNLFNENTNPLSISLRSIHKYVNDIMNLRFVGNYILTFQESSKNEFIKTISELRELRSKITLYTDIYLKNQARKQILIEDDKNDGEDTTKRRSPRHETKYYKIDPRIDFDYVLYIQSYQTIYHRFLKLSSFMNELLQLEQIVSSIEVSESITESIRKRIMTNLAIKFVETIEESSLNLIQQTITDYDSKQSRQIIVNNEKKTEDELSVNTILQQLKDLRSHGDVQVYEKDFLFNTEIQLTNFISIHRNMKKLFTQLNSGHKKVQEYLQNQDETIDNTEDKPKTEPISSQNGEEYVKSKTEPSYGEKGFSFDPNNILSNLTPKVFKRKRQETGAVTREQAAHDKGPAYGTRRAVQLKQQRAVQLKQQRTIGGANKSAYMKSLKKADEDLAKYLKKNCSIKLLK